MCGSLKMVFIFMNMLILTGISITTGHPLERGISCEGRKNKTGSEKCCDSRNGLSLPRHLDIEDGKRIVNQMEMANVTTVWLERHRVELGGLTWTNGTKFVTSHKTATPDRCGAINSSTGKVEFHHCSKRNIGFICEQKDCVNCLSPWFPRKNCRLLSGVCYVLFCGIDNWYAARAKCHSYGMEFATIPNSDTISALPSLKEFEVCPLKWIGLRTTEWKLTGSPDFSASWGPDEPSGNGDCVVGQHTLKRHLRWKVGSCNSLHNFICIGYPKEQNTQSTTNGKRNGATTLTGSPLLLLLFIIAMIYNSTYTQDTSERKRKLESSKGSEQSEEHRSFKSHGDERGFMDSEGTEQSGNVYGDGESLNLSENTIETYGESELGTSKHSVQHEDRESPKCTGDPRSVMESEMDNQMTPEPTDLSLQQDEGILLSTDSDDIDQDNHQESEPGASEQSEKFQEPESLKHPCDITGDLACEGIEHSENMQGGSQQGDGEESPHLSESDEESVEETEEESVTTKVSRARISSFTQPKARGKFRAPAISWKDASLTQRLATCLALMLVLGGDIELNPGPRLIWYMCEVWPSYYWWRTVFYLDFDRTLRLECRITNNLAEIKSSLNKYKRELASMNEMNPRRSNDPNLWGKLMETWTGFEDVLASMNELDPRRSNGPNLWGKVLETLREFEDLLAEMNEKDPERSNYPNVWRDLVETWTGFEDLLMADKRLQQEKNKYRKLMQKLTRLERDILKYKLNVLERLVRSRTSTKMEKLELLTELEDIKTRILKSQYLQLLETLEELEDLLASMNEKDIGRSNNRTFWRDWADKRLQQEKYKYRKERELDIGRPEQQVLGQVLIQPFLRSMNEESKMRTLERQMRGKIAGYKDGEGEFGWCLKVATGGPIEKSPNMGQYVRTRST